MESSAGYSRFAASTPIAAMFMGSTVALLAVAGFVAALGDMQHLRNAAGSPT